MDTYPIAIIQDRYSGVYSGGDWLAIACATDVISGNETRLCYCIGSNQGPSGPDTEAGSFWIDPPYWIAVGDTPDQALEKLRNSPK